MNLPFVGGLSERRWRDFGRLGFDKEEKVGLESSGLKTMKRGSVPTVTRPLDVNADHS